MSLSRADRGLMACFISLIVAMHVLRHMRDTILECIPPYRIKACDWLPNSSSCIRVSLVLRHVTSCRPTHFYITDTGPDTSRITTPQVVHSVTIFISTSFCLIGLQKNIRQTHNEEVAICFVCWRSRVRILARRPILT
jgi:hypothetical protein